MFYISGKKNDLYGIVDTNDNVEEFYTADQVKYIINSGITIQGARVMHIQGNSVKYDSLKVNTKYLKGTASDEIASLLTSEKCSVKPRAVSSNEQRLLDSSTCIPVRIKLSKTLGLKQCIYMKVDKFEPTPEGFMNNRYYFYDGSGVDGAFCLSSKYLTEHRNEIILDFSNSDPTETARLLAEIRKKGANI